MTVLFSWNDPPEDLGPMHCRGCGAPLAVGPDANKNRRFYCDATCANQYPGIADNEFRDSVLTAIFARNPHLPKSALAKMFEISRQRADQVILLRSYSDGIIHRFEVNPSTE